MPTVGPHRSLAQAADPLLKRVVPAWAQAVSAEVGRHDAVPTSRKRGRDPVPGAGVTAEAVDQDR